MNVSAIFDAIVSHAMTTGLFERVNTHEPRNAPGNGLTCAVWAQSINPALGGSGLASTSGLIGFVVQIYCSMNTEPLDSVDATVIAAVDALMTDYSGDFELGGNVRNIDLLGQYGKPLSMEAGYLEIDETLYRIMTIALPVVVNDLWNQEA